MSLIQGNSIEGAGYEIQKSLRFRASASAYLSRTPTVAGNRKTWTWSGWVKRGALGTQQMLMDVNGGIGGARGDITFLSGDTLQIEFNSSGSAWNTTLITTQVFRDPSAWYHIVIALDTTQATAANRLKLYVNGNQVTTFGTATYPTQNVDQPFNTTSTHNIGRISAGGYYLDGYLTEINFIDGQALDPSYFGQQDSNGVWVPKKYAGTYGNNGFYLPFSDNSSLNGTGGTSSVTYSAGLGSWTIINNAFTVPNGSVIDAIGVYSNSSESGKYSYIVRADGGNNYTVVASTASYTHNGTGLEFQKLTSSYTVPATGTYYLAVLSPGSGLSWGTDSASSTSWLYVVGAASGSQTWSTYASSYKQPALVYRTASGLSADTSGNKNHWYANNISLTAGATYDSMLDVPTSWADGGNGRGNYCTLNPVFTLSSGATVSAGNLNIVGASASAYGSPATMLLTSGKWYFEVTAGTVASRYPVVGVQTEATAFLSSGFPGGYTANGFGYGSDGNKFVNNGAATAFGSTFTSGDVIGVAIDIDAGKVWFAKNNTWQASGDPAAGTNAAYTSTAGTALYPCVGTYNGAGTHSINFGQRPFAYTPPAGFKALCTKNLPTPSILNPKKHFDIRTRAGNGATQVQTGMLFQPYFKWTKNRQSAYNNVLTDGVRGVNQFLYSNTTGAEATASGNAFDATEYTLGPSAEVNANGEAYVDCLWKAGGAPVTNNAGSIQSQVSANPQAGFSIVTYTGTGANATVGHGLGVAPKMVIVKRRSSTDAWTVSHASLSGGTHVLLLNATDAAYTPTTLSFSGFPSSSVINLATNTAVNAASSTYVAYCFAEIPGYSKIGSYTGNGSADGPFVYCGFRPRWVLIKRTDVGGHDWYILDSVRDSYNPENKWLITNGPSVEKNTGELAQDFVANGFKIRNTGAWYNTSGGTYIFYAVAEQPFQFANAR